MTTKMKKIVLALTIVAFAVAVQAGEGKTCTKSQAACSDKDKAACAEKAKSCCPLQAGVSAKAACPTKAGCPAKGETAQKALMSPKAAAEVATAK